VAEDQHCALGEPCAYQVDEFIEVGDELLDGHGRSRDLPAERFARAPLVPVDDGEVLLQVGIEVTQQPRLGEARPSVQMDQRWIGEVLAADHHPLIAATQPVVAGLGDAVRQDLAGGRPKRRRVPGAFHRPLSS